MGAMLRVPAFYKSELRPKTPMPWSRIFLVESSHFMQAPIAGIAAGPAAEPPLV
jgi:hypothetical protein